MLRKERRDPCRSFAFSHVDLERSIFKLGIQKMNQSLWYFHLVHLMYETAPLDSVKSTQKDDPGQVFSLESLLDLPDYSYDL